MDIDQRDEMYKAIMTAVMGTAQEQGGIAKPDAVMDACLEMIAMIAAQGIKLSPAKISKRCEKSVRKRIVQIRKALKDDPSLAVKTVEIH